MDNENYFENLAKGKIKADADAGEDREAADGTESADDATASEENPMGNYDAVAANETEGAGDFEVELAKAQTSAVASRSARAARAAASNNSKNSGESKSAEWEEDGTEGQLTVDVYQTPEDIVIESAIAGVRPEDIDVNVTNDSISIRGARHRESEVGDEDYLYRECYWGRFARSIILPQEVDPENADVMFKNGILTVRLPKVNKKKSKRLRVRID